MICRALLLVPALIFSLGFPAAVFAAEKLPAGFIALAEDRMKWDDAKAFCEQKGGRLPRIDNKDSRALINRSHVKHVEGFGAPGGKMPAGLRADYYWGGTENPDRSDQAWHIDGRGGEFDVNASHKTNTRRVVCVPK